MSYSCLRHILICLRKSVFANDLRGSAAIEFINICQFNIYDPHYADGSRWGMPELTLTVVVAGALRVSL